MKLYHSLSKVSFLKKSYTGKFFFVAFLGIHIPLIGLIITLIFNKDDYSTQAILWFTLGFTLLATAVTLYVIRNIMIPINLASISLAKYRRHRTVPNLPLGYKDEAGRLLCNVQKTIEDNENYLNQKLDLVSLLTHDIKNYASQPKSLATLLLEENDLNEIKEIAKHIVTSSDNQLAFLDSFIHLLREEDALSNVEVESNRINLSEIINDIENQLSKKLSEKNIDLKKIVSNINLDLFIDEVLLSSVIFNLLHNAIKFSHRNSEIIVYVTLNKEFVEIKVSDNGIGFANNQKEQLFSKFSKMSRKGTSSEDSIGIGLYLCRQIVNKFNGYLTAYSEGENKGSVFTVGFRIDK
jgi:signal transduction histidine kinase